MAPRNQRASKLSCYLSQSMCILATILVIVCVSVQRVEGQNQLRSRQAGNLRPKLFGSSSSLQLRNQTTSNNNKLEFIEDALPADFQEMPAEQLDLGANATGRAPNPMLNVAVLQNGRVIDSAVNVHPGTPLEMIVYLDDKSAKVYGLHASSLRVQDNTLKQREEVIISNGCSIDTYIFGNFELNQEDNSLRAKFRAFKFPESNFVRFVGTVNVCIKQCQRSDCDSSSSTTPNLSTNNNRNNQQQKRKKRSANGGIVMTVSTLLRISG